MNRQSFFTFQTMVFGLVAAIVLAHGSLLKAIAMVLLGLLLGLVGTDVSSGAMRYTFGIFELADGIGFGAPRFVRLKWAAPPAR